MSEKKTPERWERIKGYNNYIVSNRGVLVNTDTGQTLSVRANQQGRLQVNLSRAGIRKTHYLHRLVAQAFVKGYDDGLKVHHIDDNYSNNTASNLRVGEKKASKGMSYNEWIQSQA